MSPSVQLTVFIKDPKQADDSVPQRKTIYSGSTLLASERT